MSETQHPDSLFERLGGKNALDAVVDLFYEKVQKDPRVSHFFEGISIQDQIKHQKLFMAYAFGGAPNYLGRNLRESHKDLVEQHGLNDSHFDAVAENLQTALNELDVSNDLSSEVIAIVSSTRDEILNR